MAKRWLTIPAAQRVDLMSKNQIAIDPVRGDEVIVGLDYDESIRYAQYCLPLPGYLISRRATEGPRNSLTWMAVAKGRYFSGLRHCQSLTANEASHQPKRLKSEERHGRPMPVFVSMKIFRT